MLTSYRVGHCSKCETGWELYPLSDPPTTGLETIEAMEDPCPGCGSLTFQVRTRMVVER